MPPADHNCGWRDEAERLKALMDEHAADRARLQEASHQIDVLKAELAELKKQVLGRKSERVPPPDDEIKKRDGLKADPEETKRKRRENAAARGETETKTDRYAVAPEARICPHHGVEMHPVGEGNVTVTFDYVPAAFIRHLHIQETLACPCPECDVIVTAEAPAKLTEGGRYGPGFVALAFR